MSTVVVVGGGPAGLAAAVELRRLGARQVVVVEREPVAGGVPRHCAHLGFGLRDLRRVLGGPAYARRWVELAARAGVDVRTEATVTGWGDATGLAVTSPRGIDALAADAVLLATGCRERPRAARLVPGDRPLGVFTTGALQQLVHLHGQRVGRRAVVVGAEHVSFSAVLSLAHAGADTAAMVTEHPAVQTYAPLAWLAAGRRGVPVRTGSRLTTIVGHRRVEGVEVTALATGAVEPIECDTVVFTGDWIPDHELARAGDLAMDPATRAPRVDEALRTSRRGVFAAGNLVHAAETADRAALGGRHAARAIAAFLASGVWPIVPPIPIACARPLRWASPSAVQPATAALPHDGFLLRVETFCGPGAVVARQNGRELWRARVGRLVPNRSVRVPVRWRDHPAADGGPVTLGLEA